MENLPTDEMPAAWKWHLDWEIEAHFEQVKIEREKKYGPKNDSSTEEADMDENLLASRFNK